MPISLPVVSPQAHQTNLSPSSRAGATITAGSPAHTKGSWATLGIDPISPEAYGIWVVVRGLHVAANVTAYLLDIGIGPSGGGSEIVVVPNLTCWGAATLGRPGARGFFFPLKIPAGGRLSARAQAATASKVASVKIFLAQGSPFPYWCSRVQDYGAVLASSRGTSVTPGNGAWGSWTEIGTVSQQTVRDHFWWLPSLDGLDDTTLTDQDFLLEIGHGPNSGAVQSIGVFGTDTDATEVVGDLYPQWPIYHPVPVGAHLWARLAAGATEGRGVMIHAMD